MSKDELRKEIAATMMDGWLESMQDGVLNIDGGESPITRAYVNPKVSAKIEALILQKVKEAEITLMDKLISEQKEFRKAQYGHIRNNNNWPRTRGAGTTTDNTVAWLERVRATLRKEDKV